MKILLDSVIFRILIFRTLSTVGFIVPISFLYFNLFGFDVADYTELKAWYAFAVIVFDIPSSALADILGRKKSMVLSALFLSSSAYVTSIGQEMWIFIFGQVLLGLSSAFLSGTMDSYLYDYMKRKQISEHYQHTYGQIIFIFQLFNGLAVWSASILFTIYAQLPYYLTCLAGLIATVSVFTLPKEEVKICSKEKTPVTKRVIGQFTTTFNEMKQNPKLMITMLLTALFLSSIIFVFETYQYYLMELGIDQKHFGLVYLVFMIITALGAKYVKPLTNLGQGISLFICLGILGVSIILMNFLYDRPILGIVNMCVQQVVYGLSFPMISSLLNSLIKRSDQRSTILSVNNTLTDLVKFGVMGLGSILISNYSVNTALMVIGTLCILISVYTVYIRKFNYSSEGEIQ